jgi:hypothetical protein
MLGDGLDEPISSQMIWIGWSHNPEVAGSNPAPATQKGPQTRAFCFQIGRQVADLAPLFAPASLWKVSILTKIPLATPFLLQIGPILTPEMRRETSRVSFLMCPFCVRAA